MTKAIAFLGATGGCGLATLSRSLSASHTCHALCRTPARLTTALETTYPGTPTSTLRITEGNALTSAAVTQVLTHPEDPNRLVDVVIFSIGGAFNAMKRANDDPTVCENSMRVLLSAIDALVERTGAPHPHIAAVSSTGVSAHGRDFPLLVAPVYHILLPGPHADKRKMEVALKGARGGWTAVRPAMLKDGVTPPGTKIRVGVEDLQKGVLESRETGYFITRDDVGKWMFQNFVEGDGAVYSGKAVSLTN